ncbi:MAG TPA: acyl-CoA reductase [Myxococcota bacterium]|nr:acyl-CoA reductase [Myxococcota bacterium]HQK52523.1 acyl-CoA reductase [Myxococcota bacterium]
MRPVPPAALDDASLAESLARLARAGEDLRWLTPKDRSSLERSTGLLGPHLEEALRRAFAPYTPGACRRLVRKARSPATPDHDRVLLAILAGPIPALATGVIFPALAARFAVRIRPSAREPRFARLILSLVSRVTPELAPSLGLVPLRSGDPRLDREVRDAPVVLAYGTDETLRSLAALRRDRPLLGGGHRESLVVLDGPSLASPATRRRLARAVARDVCVYDQGGCLSPTLLVLGPGAQGDCLLADLREALSRQTLRWPVRPPSLEVRGWLRLQVEALKDRTTGPGGSCWSPPGALTPTLAVLPTGVPPLRPSPGHRVLQVIRTGDPADLPRLVPDLADHLQGIAITGDPERWWRRLPESFRAPYRCRPGRLQAPPAGWPENGRPLHLALAQIGNPVTDTPARGAAVTPARRRR